MAITLIEFLCAIAYILLLLLSALCLVSIHTTNLLLHAIEKQKVQDPASMAEEDQEEEIQEEEIQEEEVQEEEDQEEDQEEDREEDRDLDTSGSSEEPATEDDDTPPQESNEEEEIRNRLLRMIDSWKPIPIPDLVKAE